ncbi:MAG: hypothetical protein R3C68_12165 [Myxococcota bacterium]
MGGGFQCKYLVNPGDMPPGRQERIMEFLTSEEDAGSRSLGRYLPHGHFSTGVQLGLVVWRSSQGPTIRWTTAVVTPLRRVGAELKETAARPCVVGVAIIAAIVLAVIVALWFMHVSVACAVASLTGINSCTPNGYQHSDKLPPALRTK